MSFKKSLNSVEKNASIWSENLSTSMKIKRNSSIPLVDNLTELVRMPRNRDILGRFVKLRTDLKERGKRISFITEELQHLWNKFSFPTVSKPLIFKKSLKDLLQNTKAIGEENHQSFKIR